MSKYASGKIYKIVCDEPDLVYYGSTRSTLSKRIGSHRYLYKQYCENPSNKKYCTSFEVLSKPGSQIVLVEKYPCETKEELDAQERHYIDTKPCVNKNRPGALKALGQESYNKIYNAVNKQKQSDARRKVYIENKDAIKARTMDYYAKNRDKILKHAGERVTCPGCGAVYKRAGKTQHLATAKHNRGITRQKTEEDDSTEEEIQNLMNIDADLFGEPNNSPEDNINSNLIMDIMQSTHDIIQTEDGQILIDDLE